MHIKELCGKKICILGFGREGQATIRALERYASDAAIFIADANSQQEHAEYSFITGPEYLENIDKKHFSTIIKSPGIPPHPLFKKWKEEGRLTSATQIFFDFIADSGATVIGVTGSKGKSTTASLIYEILRAAPHPSPLPVRPGHPGGPRGEGVSLVFPLPLGEGQGERSVYLIGNIGAPALDFLDKAKPSAIFVMELSSYQLMDLTVSPPVAIITSFFLEHLDYHGSLEAYREAKRNICRFQKESDVVFYSSQARPPHPALSPSPSCAKASVGRRGERVERVDGDGPYRIAMASPSKRIAYSEEDAPVTLEETQLIGTHNLRNIAGAWKVTEHLGVSRDVAIDAIKAFRPLPNRLQSLGIHHGIEWIDDAISTTPESTIAALDALDGRVTTIILGGQDRGNDFVGLARRLKNSSVKTIILFPGSGPRIRHAIQTAGTSATFHEATSMETAVSIAKRVTSNEQQATSAPSIVLLSTASPSYNMFKNFEEKGDCFQRAIQQLTHGDEAPSSHP